MDPKKMAQLDPKLKEAYERVMGSSTGAPSAPTATQAPASIPQSPITQTPMESMHATIPVQNPAMTPPAPVVHATNNKQPGNNVNISSAFVATKKSAGISPLLLWVLGAIFFIAYAIFWIKFFNLSIPYLPF